MSDRFNAGDDEMYLVRNIRWLKDERVPRETWEYQVTADAYIVGDVSYGPYRFRVWEIGIDKKEGDDRWLCLRVEHRMTSDDDRFWEAASRQGFYHGGGVPDEIVSLACLFLRRRLRLGRVVRMRDDPIMIDRHGRANGWIDRALVSGQSDLTVLREWFPLVEGLRSALHQRFILAVKHYQQALHLIEDSPQIAYLSLVSAIEILSGDFDIGQPTLADYDANLGLLVGQIQDQDLRRQIENRILRLQRFIGRRFVAFVEAYLDQTFWDEPDRAEQGRVDPSELRRLLKRVYGQRSKTLHEGEPFPATIERPPLQAEEIPSGYSVAVGERLWDQADFVPHPHFFERLVRHVLLNYLRVNQ